MKGAGGGEKGQKRGRGGAEEGKRRGRGGAEEGDLPQVEQLSVGIEPPARVRRLQQAGVGRGEE